MNNQLNQRIQKLEKENNELKYKCNKYRSKLALQSLNKDLIYHSESNVSKLTLYSFNGHINRLLYYLSVSPNNIDLWTDRNIDAFITDNGIKFILSLCDIATPITNIGVDNFDLAELDTTDFYAFLRKIIYKSIQDNVMCKLTSKDYTFVFDNNHVTIDNQTNNTYYLCVDKENMKLPYAIDKFSFLFFILRPFWFPKQNIKDLDRTGLYDIDYIAIITNNYDIIKIEDAPFGFILDMRAKDVQGAFISNVINKWLMEQNNIDIDILQNTIFLIVQHPLISSDVKCMVWRVYLMIISSLKNTKKKYTWLSHQKPYIPNSFSQIKTVFDEVDLDIIVQHKVLCKLHKSYLAYVLSIILPLPSIQQHNAWIILKAHLRSSQDPHLHLHDVETLKLLHTQLTNINLTPEYYIDHRFLYYIFNPYDTELVDQNLECIDEHILDFNLYLKKHQKQDIFMLENIKPKLKILASSKLLSNEVKYRALVYGDEGFGLFVNLYPQYIFSEFNNIPLKVTNGVTNSFVKMTNIIDSITVKELYSKILLDVNIATCCQNLSSIDVNINPYFHRNAHDQLRALAQWLKTSFQLLNVSFNNHMFQIHLGNCLHDNFLASFFYQQQPAIWNHFNWQLCFNNIVFQFNQGKLEYMNQVSVSNSFICSCPHDIDLCMMPYVLC